MQILVYKYKNTNRFLILIFIIVIQDLNKNYIINLL